MKGYMPQMLDLAIQLMFKWKRLNPEDEIDVAGDMMRLTLDTIGLCGFGYRFNSLLRHRPTSLCHRYGRRIDEGHGTTSRGMGRRCAFPGRRRGRGPDALDPPIARGA
jgi:cytochrome P450/NADPH-cytochrome P450 reductase